MPRKRRIVADSPEALGICRGCRQRPPAQYNYDFCEACTTATHEAALHVLDQYAVKVGPLRTSRDRLLDRLKTFALVACNPRASTSEKLDAFRECTSLLLHTLGTARGELLAGCEGTPIIRQESLTAIMHEQVAIAQQAIREAREAIRLVRGADAANAYAESSQAELEATFTEDLSVYHASLVEAAEASAREEMQELGHVAARTAVIEGVFALAHRGN